MEIYKKDKNNINYVTSTNYPVLTIAPSGTGELLLKDEYEFAVYEILAPGNLSYKIDLYINMGTIDTEQWELLETFTKLNTEQKMFKWVSDLLFTVKNGFKIVITNNEAGDKDFSLFVPFGQLGAIFGRRF